MNAAQCEHPVKQGVGFTKSSSFEALFVYIWGELRLTKRASKVPRNKTLKTMFQKPGLFYKLYCIRLH